MQIVEQVVKIDELPQIIELTDDDRLIICQDATGRACLGEIKSFIQDGLSQKLDGLSQKQDGLSQKQDGIIALIPGQAGGANQLADKNFVNSSITAMAAHHLTYDAEGGPFPTKGALNSAKTFYYKGAAFTPTEHDYCIVTADESRNGAQVRYNFDGEQWVCGYVVNDKPFTAAQMAAINSDITAALTGKLAALPDNAALTALLNEKQNNLNRAVAGNDNATGSVNDTGGNLSIPIPVTVEAPTASSTQTAQGTRSLRAQLKLLIDNIAHLFANKVDKITAITAVTTAAAKKIAYNAQGQITASADLTALDMGRGYGTCSTAASAAAKVGTLANFVRSTGAVVGIAFDYANTAANPTLNVNDTGAASILDYKKKSAVVSGDMGAAVHIFMFNGSQWVLLNTITVASFTFN